MRNAFTLSLVFVATVVLSADDWPMWGGSPSRNMVSPMTGAPTEWDVKSGKNVKWVAELGSQSYGNPSVGSGVVIIGTNNELMRDGKQAGDRGVVMAFREATGEFLWQATFEKLSSGRANDWPFQGIASSPLIMDGVAYFVSNRGQVIAADVDGFHDGTNDGAIKDEKLTGKNDPDFIWVFDMMEEVGSFPHNLSNSSPVVYQNLLFVNTSNGQDESHVNIPSPKAPAIIAIDKNTGKLVWEDNSVEDRILHGQWSTPAVGEVGGVMQVVHAQGDGWVRGYEVLTGKKLWEFDTNPKDSVWPKTRNEVISTPVIYENVVYISNGQDPEHGEGVGHAYAIDATKRGDITQSGRLWHFDKIRRSISTAAIKDGLIYLADFSGFFHCLDLKTGQVLWTHDMFAAIWGSPMIIGDKVYLGDEDGDVVVVEHGRTLKIVSEQNMGSSVYSTVVPANGAIFVMNRNQLYALQQGSQYQKPSAQ
ncbi:MAG TPA: PQQ-binding-like beta-propeller repeat protein [Vicinamibacterales bacterium]|nr:PQQ-binding-like beta-propeller repeat protein [Vicinamibacterales bacterium]